MARMKSFYAPTTISALPIIQRLKRHQYQPLKNMVLVPAHQGLYPEIWNCMKSLSRAEVKRYPHKDVERLERLLRETGKRRNGEAEKDSPAHRFTDSPIRKLIVTDGIFSVDGDIAPLKELSELADKYKCMLMVDDAHATGVLGSKGKGTSEHFGIDNTNIIQMGTLGKALGCFGAYVAGSRKLIDY